MSPEATASRSSSMMFVSLMAVPQFVVRGLRDSSVEHHQLSAALESAITDFDVMRHSWFDMRAVGPQAFRLLSEHVGAMPVAAEPESFVFVFVERFHFVAGREQCGNTLSGAAVVFLCDVSVGIERRFQSLVDSAPNVLEQIATPNAAIALRLQFGCLGGRHR